jgi:hypothetical protein
MQHLLFAGLSFDPAIRGILVVTIAVAILGGSVYLIVATNTGARLGLLITLGSLFGFLSILTGYWWIQPPGIGPRGQDPTWKPVEIVVHEPENAQGPARTEVVNMLPEPSDPRIPSAAEVIAAHPEIAKDIVGKPENASLTDIAAIKHGDEFTGADILKQYFGLKSTQPSEKQGDDVLGGWEIVTTSQAGEAAAAADAALIESKLFKDATEYKRVGAFEWNEEQTRQEACPAAEGEAGHNILPPDFLCRAKYRVAKTFRLFHPPRYQVIQVQPVIPQETKEGEPPPVPKADPSKPVVSIVLIRDQGNVRAKPAYFFAISFSLFIVFALILHYRDKTLMQNLADAEVAKAEAKKKKK